MDATKKLVKSTMLKLLTTSRKLEDANLDEALRVAPHVADLPKQVRKVYHATYHQGFYEGRIALIGELCDLFTGNQSLVEYMHNLRNKTAETENAIALSRAYELQELMNSPEEKKRQTMLRNKTHRASKAIGPKTIDGKGLGIYG